MCTRGLRTRFSFSWMLSAMVSPAGSLPRAPGCECGSLDCAHSIRAGVKSEVNPLRRCRSFAARRADAEIREDGRALGGVRHDLCQEFGPGHAGAPHRFG